jgi:hypothetical protein
VGGDRDAWRDGRRVWDRLDAWYQDVAARPGIDVDNGDEAVDALDDIGRIRHLLDQAEMVAVGIARRHRKSWAEIATKLGVSRQSAWERWRDLEEDPRVVRRGSAQESALAGEAAATAEAARSRRRRSSVVVPNVVGMPWDRAREVLLDKGLVAVGPDPDGLPLAALGWPGGTVTDQSPESGARVPAGSSVTLWLERGDGSAGVREPRRPTPSPKSARAMLSEPDDEAAVG